MALEFGAKKTDHNGAKNSGHDKIAPRAELKDASRKLRRAADRAMTDGQYDEFLNEVSAQYPFIRRYLAEH